MARFIAGDELGGLKAVSFSYSDNKINVTSLRAGGEDKTRAVQRLAAVPSSSSPESALFASAHADGSAAAYTLSSDGELETVKEWTEPRLKAGQKYVGLALAESSAYSCTSNGALRLTNLPSSSETAPEHTSSRTAVLPMRLADWRLSSSSRIFAYAGDEVELSLWDTERAFAARDNKPVPNAEQGKKKRKRVEELLPGETWRARNVPNDTLSLRQPVRNTTLTFLNGRDDSLAVGTAFGDVRRYDVRAQKRPVANWTGIGKVGGIAAIESGEHELYVSDNGTSVFSLDVRTGTILGGYAGIAGAVHTIATGPKGLIASAARDRYVRVHSTPGFDDKDEEGDGKGAKGDGKGKVLDKAYFKSVPSALVWDGLHIETAQGDEGDESNEEDVWDGLDVVDEDDDDEEAERKKARRKRAKGGDA